ncbi:MAG: hypothetical protein IPN46_17820 [Saprospiraceae bacterium]|nr:hypothetical protein [Saprospiraceae bacterium]
MEKFIQTPKGSETIKKYSLDHALLIKLRANKLIEFYDTLQKLRNNQIKENGRDLTEAEIVILRRFAQPDYPFSLMFRLLLKKLNLL